MASRRFQWLHVRSLVPAFSFAIFLGGLAAINQSSFFTAGSFVAFMKILTPGIVLVLATIGAWEGLLSRCWVKSGVRGLIVGDRGACLHRRVLCLVGGLHRYRFLSARSLENDPWWEVVAARTYLGGRYFGLVSPIVMVLGSVLGVTRHGVDALIAYVRITGSGT